MRLSLYLQRTLEDISRVENQSNLVQLSGGGFPNLYGFETLFAENSEGTARFQVRLLLPKICIQYDRVSLPREVEREIHDIAALGERFFTYSITIREGQNEYTRTFLSPDYYAEAKEMTTLDQYGIRYEHFRLTFDDPFEEQSLDPVEISGQVRQWVVSNRLTDSDLKGLYYSMRKSKDKPINHVPWIDPEAEMDLYRGTLVLIGGFSCYYVSEEASCLLPTSIAESVISRAAPHGHKYHAFPAALSVQDTISNKTERILPGTYLIPDNFWLTNKPSWPEVDRRLGGITRTRQRTDDISESNANLRRRL